MYGFCLSSPYVKKNVTMKFVMKYLGFIAVFFVLGIFSFSAYAQLEDPTVKPLPEFLDGIGGNNTALPPEEPKEDETKEMVAPKPERPKSDLSDIPDEYIIEASKFGEECRNDYTLPLYFDCRCMAVTFLDERIKRGPDASVSGIRNSMGDKCKDGTGIAGQIYEECLNDFVNAPKHLDPEEFCSCYGNTYAEIFEDFSGAVTAKANIALRSKAKTVCQDPVAGRRIYGPGAIPR